MNEIAIKVENISKRYRIGASEEKADNFSDALVSWLRSPFSSFRRVRSLSRFEEREDELDIVWALKNVSFEIEQEDVVGIIGRNGAGKSTLLKVISRITEPTSGRVFFNGRVASLLEVGTGFHPELTGRENIYLNGTVLGMTRSEVTAKFDEIVEFSEIEKFIDTPVKRYSSGMTVRLAFSVAAHLEPEILLVDEVLAVGDAAFQKKCLKKMGDATYKGRTILFVSHNMGAIANLCPRCIWIDNGKVRLMGDSNEVISTYLKKINPFRESNEAFFEKDTTKEFQLRSARLIDQSGAPVKAYSCDEPVILEMTCQVHQQIKGLYGYLAVMDSSNNMVIESDSFDTGHNPLDDLMGGDYKARIAIPPRTLAPGDYIIYLNFTSRFSKNNFNVDSPGQICSFHMDDFKTKRGNRRLGYSSLILPWEIEKN